MLEHVHTDLIFLFVQVLGFKIVFDTKINGYKIVRSLLDQKGDQGWLV